MKKVLILSFSTIASDPRVMRQVRLLENLHELTIAGYGAAPASKGRFVSVVAAPSPKFKKLLWGTRLLAGAFDAYYWALPQVQNAAQALQGLDADLIIANDLPALPLALSLARGQVPVFFDAHEYSPGEYEDQWLWRLLFQRYVDDLCRRHLPRCAAMSTVCAGIADAYASHYGVQPFVVHNAPMHQVLPVSPVADDRIRLIHHGVASRVRRLEGMIDMMKSLDERFTLDLMLVDAEPRYLASLRQLAAHDTRIRFLPPVPMPDICKTLQPYDIGVFLLPPTSFNYRYALPNKFFEFVQARLGVAIGPSPEMKALAEQHGCGVIANSFDPVDLAQALKSLTSDDVRRLKTAANRAAPALGFEHDAARVLATVERLLA